MKNYTRGGIAIFIMDGISFSVVNNPSNMKALVVRLKLASDDLTIVYADHRPIVDITDDVISDYR